jgi:acyl-CoA:acyl-CoA alkyltransferase
MSSLTFQNVSIASVGWCLPSEVITSESIEQQLEEVYQRLRLPPGRLEMMSGIGRRRLWPSGQRLSQASIESGRRALQAADCPAAEVGCLIHASVCREFLEPATACRVHHELGLPPSGWVYDLSNACLGMLNAMVNIAVLIESGVIEAGLAVGTEDARGLLEATVRQLRGDRQLTRRSIKPAFASLTIGSGSCAVLLRRTRPGQVGGRLRAAAARAETQHNTLCQSHGDQAGGSMQPLMQTDSEGLLVAGVEAGAANFDQLRRKVSWGEASPVASVCHQVGAAHQRLMLERLGLPPENDFATYHWLGNTGSVALPTALGIGLASGQLDDYPHAWLLGIGSGINSVMLAVDLPGIVSCGEFDSDAAEQLAARAGGGPRRPDRPPGD